MCICFSLRLTPQEIDPSANPASFIHLFKGLIRTYNIKDYALGWEKLNKYGEPTKPHYHFNFIADAKKETIQTFVRRYDSYTIKGKTMYAVSRHPEPDDFNRWFRYVAKENLVRSMCKGFTTTELNEMEMLAKDERKRSVAFNINKRKIALEKNTLYDKYEKKLDIYFNKSKQPQTYKTVWLRFLYLYVEDRKSINPQTIKGYTNLYLLQNKCITHEQFFMANNSKAS